MNPDPTAQMPSEGPTSPQEAPSLPPSVGDYLGGLSAPMAAPSRSTGPTGRRLVVTSSRESVTNMLGLIVERSGMSQAEIARQMGIRPQSLNQYLTSRRSNPAMTWLARLAEVVGARLVVEWPARP